MKKIAIIYQNAGGGHISLANSVIDALNKYFPGKFKIVEFDPFPYLYNKSYEILNSDLQNVWKLSWHTSNKREIAQLVQKATFLATGNKVIKFLKKEKPDLILSNIPPGIFPVNLAIQKSKIRTKNIIHFSDPFTLHELWFTNKTADLYLSPTIEVTTAAIKHGIDKKRIKTVGWPLRSSFYKKTNILQLKTKYNIDPKKQVIFIGGGGQGGGRIFEICKKIFESKKIMASCEILVITGKNKVLFNKLKKEDKKFKNLQVISYTSGIAEIISLSDLVIGKAGPNFMFEVLSLNKPFIAAGALPGQEQGNLAFILKYDLGWVEENPKKIKQLVEKLVFNNKLLGSKVPNTKKIKKLYRNTGKKIANAIYELAY